MARKNLKLRVDDEGRLEIVDPGFDTLDLLRSINPDFQIQTAPLPSFASPRFLETRKQGCGLKLESMKALTDERLWDVHDQTLEDMPTRHMRKDPDEASLLDLKIELACRIMKSCHLCGRNCGVNRIAGERGKCGLGTNAVVLEHFVHIAEEPPINPSLNLFLAGCGLQCCFCQQRHLLTPSTITGDQLEPSLWKRLKKKDARSLSFIGGNPDESLLGILKFLSTAPKRWRLPIVWNCHAYATQETVKLLHGVVDAYVPDMKFGNPECGNELAGSNNYWDISKIAISSMVAQEVPVIVRILLLPGHFSCCHEPILKFLSGLADSSYLLISIRDQYCPGDLTDKTIDNILSERTSPEENTLAVGYARQLNLKNI